MVMEISFLRRQLRQADAPRRREPTATAVILPFPQRSPKAESPWERYPCTRMHGAAFEAEFHREPEDCV